METLYSTIYYSQNFIELNIDKSIQYVALWTHLALSGELWRVFYEYFNKNWSCYKGFLLYLNFFLKNQLVSQFICVYTIFHCFQDESHNLKNIKTARTAAALPILKVRKLMYRKVLI